MGEALSLLDDKNVDINSDIIFAITDTKLYVPVVTLSAKDTKNYQKMFRKRFERSLFWNDYKPKSENTANIFSNHTL